MTALFLSACGASGGDAGPDGTPSPDPSPSPTATDLCEPTGGGPYWLEETEPVSFSAWCASGLGLPPESFVPGELPAGASWDAATATFTWTPGLDQAETVRLPLRIPETGEETVVTIGVADRWYDAGNEPVADPTRYTHEFGLPVFFISPAPKNKDYAPSTLVYRGRAWNIEARRRGVTSIRYPKNSYTLKFPKTDKFDDPEYGFVSKRRVNLTQTFDDNSYIRNRLAFDLWAALDPHHIRVRTYSAVVYVDGEYWGLYTASDKVDGNLMDDHGLFEDGNLYEAVSHTANFSLVYGTSAKSSPHEGWLKKEGEPPDGSAGAYADLDELVTFVDTASEAEFESGIGARIDMADYQDWWILATYLLAYDSTGKNSFHYHHTGLWRFVPWDFNAAAGQSWRTTRLGWDDDQTFTHKNRIFDRFLATPAFRNGIRTRYRAALDGPLSEEAVDALLDRYWAEIAPSARRDERKWRDAYLSYGSWSDRTDFTTFEEEFAYVRDWLRQRHAWLDAEY